MQKGNTREYIAELDIRGSGRPTKHDMTGRRYGDFTIVGYARLSNWALRCIHCGSMKLATATALTKETVGKHCPCQKVLETNREREIAELVAQGLTNKQIADRLFISERTVQTHLTNLFAKYGVPNRTMLVARRK